MRARHALFVIYGAGHIAMVAPVIRELQQREPGIHIDLLALTTGAHAARAMGLAPLGYRDFAHWYDASSLQKHDAPLMAETRHPLIDEEETVAYLDINFEDLCLQLGAQAAAQAYAARSRWAFMPLHFMRRLLGHLQPDVVVTTNSPRSEEASIAVAAEMGIPSVCMVDLFSPVGDPFLDRTLYADALTAISDFGKNNLIVGGVLADRIHITGSPAFDSLTDLVHAYKAADDRAALGWQDLKVILWAGNLEEPPPGLGAESEPTFLAGGVERMLRNFVHTHPDTALVIRYHPNQIHNFDAGSPQDRVLWSIPQIRHPHRDIYLAELNMLAQWPRVLYHLDQPNGDASFMPTLRVSELAAKHVKVVLTGDGGDELFAGYDKYAAFFGRTDAQTLPLGTLKRQYFDSISLFSITAKNALYQPQIRQQLECIDSFGQAAKPWFDEAQHFDRVNQELYLDMQLLLSGNNLVKPDRMGMAVSIEARTPFFDYRMMEFAFRSRGDTKLSDRGDKKHWFKKAAAPLIGDDLAYRKKQMFTVPVGDWFRGASYPWLRNALQKSELLANIFIGQEVNFMLEKHRACTANFTRELRALAGLALWDEGRK